MDTVRLTVAAAFALPLLAVGAVALSYVGGLGQSRSLLTAALRASVQLAAVGLVITAALSSVPGSAAFLLLMLVVAAGTSARRLHVLPRVLPVAAAAIGLPVSVVLGVLFASGALPAEPLAVLPLGGITIGGAMTATTLTGRRLVSDLRDRFGEVEAGLAVGLLPDQAVREVVGRRAAAEALVPGLDQTRTVGLVTLPGAFVGMLLGGATAAQAAAVQLVVLVALLAVQTGAVLLAAELLARRTCRNGSVVRPEAL
jgi:putative ABC transport system permease protein